MASTNITFQNTITLNQDCLPLSTSCRYTNVEHCSHANLFGSQKGKIQDDDWGNGIFWMGFHGYGGFLGKVLMGVRPSDYNEMSMWFYNSVMTCLL